MSGEEGGTVTIRDMTPVDAATVATWRYDGPWSVYDVRDSATAVMTSESGYFARIEALGYAVTFTLGPDDPPFGSARPGCDRLCMFVASTTEGLACGDERWCGVERRRGWTTA